MDRSASAQLSRKQRSQAQTGSDGTGKRSPPLMGFNAIRPPQGEGLPRLKLNTLIAEEEVGPNSGTGAPMGLPAGWLSIVPGVTPTPPRKRNESITQLPTVKKVEIGPTSPVRTSPSIPERQDKIDRIDKPEKLVEKKKKKILLREIEELHQQLEDMKSLVDSKNRQLEALQDKWWRDTGSDPNSDLVCRSLQASSACSHAFSGREDHLKNMLQHGADILLSDYDGRTAMHCAARAGHAKVISFLLDSGATMDAKDNAGRTVWDEAATSRHYSIIQILDEARAFRQFKAIDKDYKLAEYIPAGHETRKVPLHETMKFQRQISKLSRFFGAGEVDRKANYAPSGSLFQGSVSASALSHSAPGNRIQAPPVVPVPSKRDPRTSFDARDPVKRDPLVSSASGYPAAPQAPSLKQVTASSAIQLGGSSASRHGHPTPSDSPQLGTDELSSVSTMTSKQKKQNRKSGGRLRRWLDWRPFRHTEASPASAHPTKREHVRSNSYGIAFGRLRGACQAAECHCASFRKDPTVPGVVMCSCKHFPATHIDLGEAEMLGSDLLAGLEHLNITTESSSSELLVEKVPGTSWPKIINPILEDDDIAKVFSNVVISQSDPIVDARDIVFLKHLGKGASATVYLGSLNGKLIAIKVIDFMPTSNRSISKIQHEMTEELRVMSALSQHSANVVKFFGVVTHPRLCILLEYCEHGSLTDVLSKPQLHLDWSLFFVWAKQITQGLADLHNWDPPIVHRDMKSLNLLVDSNQNVKVADFGLSRFLQPDENQTTLGKMRGTYAYTDPEIYDGIKFSPKADMFSLGVIIWELVYRTLHGEYQRPYGEYPWINRDFQIIIQVARKNVRPTIPETCPPLIAEIIRSLWTRTGDDRPSAHDLLLTLDSIQEIYNNNRPSWDTLLPAPPSTTTLNGISTSSSILSGSSYDTSTSDEIGISAASHTSSHSSTDSSGTAHPRRQSLDYLTLPFPFSDVTAPFNANSLPSFDPRHDRDSSSLAHTQPIAPGSAQGSRHSNSHYLGAMTSPTLPTRYHSHDVAKHTTSHTSKAPSVSFTPPSPQNTSKHSLIDKSVTDVLPHSSSSHSSSSKSSSSSRHKRSHSNAGASDLVSSSSKLVVSPPISPRSGSVSLAPSYSFNSTSSYHDANMDGLGLSPRGRSSSRDVSFLIQPSPTETSSSMPKESLLQATSPPLIPPKIKKSKSSHPDDQAHYGSRSATSSHADMLMSEKKRKGHERERSPPPSTNEGPKSAKVERHPKKPKL